MKCPHCEYERDTAFAYCPKCGKPSTRVAEPVIACPTGHILSFIKDDLFLTICILLTAAVGCSMLSGGFNVIAVLITIFSWLTYAGGKKNIVEHKHIRVISGSVYAHYVIKNILAGIIAFLGVFYTIFLSIPALMGGLNMDEILKESSISPEFGLLSLIPVATIGLLSVFATVLGFIFIALAIGILIFNIAGRKKIHRFIQSIYKSAEAGKENIVGTNKVGGWLITFAVLYIIIAISSISNGNIFGFITEGCFAAIYIILNVLVTKHFYNK